MPRKKNRTPVSEHVAGKPHGLEDHLAQLFFASFLDYGLGTEPWSAIPEPIPSPPPRATHRSVLMPLVL